MSELRKAAEMALEVMEYNRANGTPNMGAAIEALRQALKQPEQEPFGYFRYDLEWDGWVETEPNNGEPLYTAPPSIEAAVLAEREACAKVCDLVAKEIDDTNGIATYCAAAIRARGEK